MTRDENGNENVMGCENSNHSSYLIYNPVKRYITMLFKCLSPMPIPKTPNTMLSVFIQRTTSSA